jgi:acyl carrier protein
MDRLSIEKRVKGVIARVLGVDPQEVRPESHFVFDLGADSLQSVQLVAAFEGEFGIEMDNDAALRVQHVGAAVDFIEHCLHANDLLAKTDN